MSSISLYIRAACGELVVARMRARGHVVVEMGLLGGTSGEEGCWAVARQGTSQTWENLYISYTTARNTRSNNSVARNTVLVGTAISRAEKREKKSPRVQPCYAWTCRVKLGQVGWCWCGWCGTCATRSSRPKKKTSTDTSTPPTTHSHSTLHSPEHQPRCRTER